MIGCVRWRLPEVDSTQNIAFRLAELGSPHGTVVRADYQSAGRGRQGRVWESPRGSALMFSIILRPSFSLYDLAGISILVADVLADSLAEIVTAPVQIKWPNDVLIKGEKTSGILLQTRSGPEPMAVLGMGVNIDFPSGSLPSGSTCLSQHADQPIGADELLSSVLARLNSLWDSFQPELTEAQIEGLESRLWQLGQNVSIIDSNREIQGRILGVAENGGLRLSVEGSERVVMAGEISRGPRPIGGSNVN